MPHFTSSFLALQVTFHGSCSQPKQVIKECFSLSCAQGHWFAPLHSWNLISEIRVGLTHTLKSVVARTQSFAIRFGTWT